MPTKHFGFERNEPKRLRLSYGPFIWSDLKINLDGSEIGRCTAREFRAGREFSLPDSSKVYVRFTMSGLDVRRDGKSLPGSGSDPIVMLRSAYMATFLVGGGNLLVGALSLLNEQLRNAFGWPSLIGGLVLLVLGTYVKRRSKVALIIALSIVGLVLVALLLGLPQTLPSIPIGAFVLYLMTRGLRGLRELERQPVAGELT